MPELDGDTDAGYFDDFSNEADMAKYKEVHDKQTALENMEERKDPMSKVAFVGFTFRCVGLSFLFFSPVHFRSILVNVINSLRGFKRNK